MAIGLRQDINPIQLSPAHQKTDIPTLLSADILALLLQQMSPPFREVTI
jgi:hypothetical protein